MECKLKSHGNLVRQLREPVPPLVKLIAVPSLPTHYFARVEPLRTLWDALRADLDRPVVITGAAARMGAHGMGQHRQSLTRLPLPCKMHFTVRSQMMTIAIRLGRRGDPVLRTQRLQPSATGRVLCQLR